ncbi:MAG: SDR family oxidoreductase [Pseudomonadales bacterium]|nr:SDR family oxidoreductase [Pseudomonadales bacterium]
MNLDLEKKHVLVTGSNRGTGNIIANMFLEQGAEVYFHSNRDGASQDAVSEAGAGTALWGDITDNSGSNQVIDQLKQNTNHLDILVNNYGEARRGNWENTNTEDWIELYNINTLSIVRLTQGLLPLMGQGGRIINLGTIGSTRPNRVMPHYYAAKGALATLTVSLAKETGPKGITTNLVSPGLIRTPEVEASYLDKAKREGWGNTFEEAEQKIADTYFPNPLGRFATREEVAGIILFLSGPQAAFINGQNIRVDGGAVDIV